MSTLPPPEKMAQVVSEVTETVLGLTFHPDPEDAPWAHLVWRAAVLPIRGQRPLTVGLSSDEAGCISLGARMFEVEAGEVSDDMMSDALCELVNMTAGLLKVHLALEQTLGLPRVVPEGQLPVASPRPETNRVVLRAEKVNLVLWIFEGLVD